MSDAIKWALLVAAAIAVIALILALPVAQYINPTEFGDLIGRFVGIAGGVLMSGRALINNFLTRFGVNLLTGLIAWLVGKWFLTMGIKIGAWLYHYIFK